MASPTSPGTTWAWQRPDSPLQQAKRVKSTESDWWGRKEEKVSQCPSSKEGSWCWRHHCPAHVQGWHQIRLEPWLPSEANRRRAKWEWWRSEGPNRDPSFSACPPLPSRTWVQGCKNFCFVSKGAMIRKFYIKLPVFLSHPQNHIQKINK